jgi:superfamily II DNA or RNA helicase
MVLRPYQNKLISDIRDLFLAGHKSVLLQSSTGSGKTAIAAEMIRLADNKGSSIWFICNRQELIHQTSAALNKIFVKHSFIAAGFDYDRSASVFVCSIQTLYRRYGSINPPKLAFWDEAHSIVAKTWSDVYEYTEKSYHVLLTATPTRLSGEGFRDFATALVKGPSVADLIEMGFLSNYRAFAPSQIDTSKFHTRMGEFRTDDVMDVVNKDKFIGDAVKEYKSKFLGRKNLVFCVNIEHSKHVRDQFVFAGISCEHVDGKTDSVTRDKIIKDFMSGKINVLTSVDLLTTGFDCPGIEVVTFLRPTKSTSLALQMMGRGMRIYPGKKDVIFLDHVNLFRLHGLPDDERDWSLDGVKSKIKKNELAVKICPTCFAALRLTAKTCGECGNTIPSKRDDLDLQSLGTNDDLKEVDKKKFKSQGKDIDRARAKTKDELVKYAIEKGMKKPHAWAHYVFQARQRKKLQDR